jgi:CBS domain-containing protein
VREALVSLAGLMDRPVKNQMGAEIGNVGDVVAKWGDGDTYPPVTGLVMKVGRRKAFVDVSQLDRLEADVQLRSARLDLRDFLRRPGEVLLARDVLDHQLVDVEGAQVVRAADLYLARVQGVYRLVGVDVGLRTLARRLGPTRWRSRPTPERVIDWATIEPFGGPVAQVQLRSPRSGLHRLRPGELADLLEDLERPARQELLSALEPDVAADALEAMDPGEREALLRESPPDMAASLVAEMEPDEAVEALRDLEPDRRKELLEQMPSDNALELSALLTYEERTAGGIMTTSQAIVSPHETVGSMRERLRQDADESSHVTGVVVVDDDGRLIDDVSVMELFLAAPEDLLESLVGPPSPVTVAVDASISEVAERMLEGRSSSLVVVDDHDRPVGRILADDVIDALVPERGRLHFPRLLQ